MVVPSRSAPRQNAISGRQVPNATLRDVAAVASTSAPATSAPSRIGTALAGAKPRQSREPKARAARGGREPRRAPDRRDEQPECPPGNASGLVDVGACGLDAARASCETE